MDTKLFIKNQLEQLFIKYKFIEILNKIILIGIVIQII
jgi:hypothetical protein